MRKIDGQWVTEVITTPEEDKAIVDANQQIAASATKPGGAGSDNFRHVGRIPITVYANWVAEWKQLGGHKGTGMSSKEFCLVKMSDGNHGGLIGTPSGRTGYERKARRKHYS